MVCPPIAGSNAHGRCHRTCARACLGERSSVFGRTVRKDVLRALSKFGDTGGAAVASSPVMMLPVDVAGDTVAEEWAAVVSTESSPLEIDSTSAAVPAAAPAAEEDTAKTATKRAAPDSADDGGVLAKQPRPAKVLGGVLDQLISSTELIGEPITPAGPATLATSGLPT